MDSKGIFTNFGNVRWPVRRKRNQIVSGLLRASCTKLGTCNTVGSVNVASQRLHHEKLSHLGEVGNMKMPQRRVVCGLPDWSESIGQTCYSRVVSKTNFAALLYCWVRPRAISFLELVLTDVCGPFQVPSVCWARYFITNYLWTLELGN